MGEVVVDVADVDARWKGRLGGFSGNDIDCEYIWFGGEGFDNVVSYVGAPGLVIVSFWLRSCLTCDVPYAKHSHFSQASTLR